MATRQYRIARSVFNDPEMNALFGTLRYNGCITCVAELGDILISVSQKRDQPSLELGDAGVEKDFAIWYAMFPHKVGKGQALKAFRKARRTASLEALQIGLRQYITDKPESVPWCNPATWLNGERWLDKPAKDGGYGQQDQYAARAQQREAAAGATRQAALDTLAELAGMARPVDADRATTRGDRGDRRAARALRERDQTFHPGAD